MKWLLGVSMVAIAMGWVAVATVPVATASIDDASFRFLPPETQGVAFIDVAALRDAPLVQDLFKSSSTSFPRDFVEFMTATGFDPKRDIDKVTVGKVNAQDGLVIAQGRIDRFKVEQFLKDKGKVPEAYLGQSLYRDGDKAFVLFDNLAVFGPVDTVKKALDQRQLPGSLPLRSDLMAAIQSVEAGNQVWGVGDFTVNDLKAAGVRGPAPVIDMLQSLESGTYQMRVDSGIHARATGKFADAQSAQNIAELARGALAIARMQVAKKQPDVVAMLDGVQIGSS